MDYTFCGWLDEYLLYKIPIEAKCQVIPKNMNQLCHYMSTINMGECCNVGVGMLIDASNVHLAFAFMKVHNATESHEEIPAPTILLYTER